MGGAVSVGDKSLPHNIWSVEKAVADMPTYTVHTHVKNTTSPGKLCLFSEPSWGRLWHFHMTGNAHMTIILSRAHTHSGLCSLGVSSTPIIQLRSYCQLAVTRGRRVSSLRDVVTERQSMI